jgi:hypothetical protein
MTTNKPGCAIVLAPGDDFDEESKMLEKSKLI